jgi:hypothetical protein
MNRRGFFRGLLQAAAVGFAAKVMPSTLSAIEPVEAVKSLSWDDCIDSMVRSMLDDIDRIILYRSGHAWEAEE